MHNDATQELKPETNFVWELIFGIVLTTLGWNYGVSEVVQAVGGPDGNLNILEGAALFVSIGILGRLFK